MSVVTSMLIGDKTVNLTYMTRAGKCVLPSELILQQGLSIVEVKKIIQLHKTRDTLLGNMEAVEDTETLRNIAKKLVSLDKKLQLTWKFTYNANKYKFWNLPKCSCPKMDNDDNYPHGYYVVSGDCPIHGSNPY